MILYVHTKNARKIGYLQDEEEFIFRKAPFKDYDELREEFAKFLHFYNYERPHLGIDLRRPIDIIREKV